MCITHHNYYTKYQNKRCDRVKSSSKPLRSVVVKPKDEAPIPRITRSKQGTDDSSFILSHN